MRRSNSDSPSTQQPQTRIGMHAPKRLRVGSLKHPAGHDLPDGGRIPCVVLRGMWLERFELPVGARVLVEVAHKRVTLRLDETPVVVPYRYQDHVPKKKRRVLDVTTGEVLE